MRKAHPLAFLLTRASLAAPFVLRINLEQQPLASFRRADARVSAAAIDAYRALPLNADRIPRAILRSDARAVVAYMWARVASVAREPEAGLEAAPIDVIR